MATKPTGVGRGGRRERAGRPKGAKSKTLRPTAVERLARDGMLPKEVMLDVMRQHYRAGHLDKAARIAALAAPYIHPRLSAAAITVRPRLSEMSDEELAAFIAEAEQNAGITEGALAAVKPRGNA